MPPRNNTPKPPKPKQDPANLRRLREGGVAEGLASTRPGLQPDEDYRDYDRYFNNTLEGQSAVWLIGQVGSVDPSYAKTIRQAAWTYRFDTTGDALNRVLGSQGILDALSRVQGGSGSGSRGGGGASKAQQYAQAEATIRNEVKSMGVAFSDESIKQLAKSVVDGNWSPDMVTDYIVAGSGDWDTLQAGQITATADAVRKMAASQLITVSEDTAREYARRVASGDLTQDGINAIMLGQAKAQFAWLTPQLDSGMTVRDILLPSRDVIARELEMNADTIDLANTKWQNMLTVKEPNGTTRAATNNELVVNARRSSEWQNTKGARDLTAAAIMRIRSIFYGD
jgi:hypothetical protein